MSSVFYVMLILPLIVIVMFTFVFQDTFTSLNKVKDEILCPMPSVSGLWKNGTGLLTYKGGTYNYPNVSNKTITLTCTPIHTFDGVDYAYGQPTVAIGVFFFGADTISEIGHKIGAFFTMLGLWFVLPSEVTGVSWFIYVQTMLIALPILAIVMIIRGGSA